jgi:hypothetical protein
MNTVFDPKILFISDEDWLEEEKQDAFLEHLLKQLTIIDEFDICRIFWSDELQELLVANPQSHPWYGTDTRNSMIAIIHQKFYTRAETIAEHEEPCTITPDFNQKVRDDADLHFLQLIHGLIELEEAFYLALGVGNQLPKGEHYIFSCTCHADYSPALIFKAKEWLEYVDEVEKFFPISVEEFDEKFEIGLDLVKRKYFEAEDEEVDFLYEYEFTNKFKKSIVSRNTFQAEIFKAIVKKLISTSAEAGASELKDEWLKQSKMYRFRVTKRPSSTRIHYDLYDDRIIFDKYYGEGEHDDGL